MKPCSIRLGSHGAEGTSQRLKNTPRLQWRDLSRQLLCERSDVVEVQALSNVINRRKLSDLHQELKETAVGMLDIVPAGLARPPKASLMDGSASLASGTQLQADLGKYPKAHRNSGRSEAPEL